MLDNCNNSYVQFQRTELRGKFAILTIQNLKWNTADDMLSELKRTPRSEIEAKFQSLQQESDSHGFILLNGGSWRLEEPETLSFSRVRFNEILQEAQQLAGIYLGETESQIGLNARYLYESCPGINKARSIDAEKVGWKVVKPIDSLNYAADIEGEMDKIVPIKARDPESNLFGWRICAVVRAYKVMGLHMSADNPKRLGVAIPLSQILTLPVKYEEMDSIMLGSEK